MQKYGNAIKAPHNTYAIKWENHYKSKLCDIVCFFKGTSCHIYRNSFDIVYLQTFLQTNYNFSCLLVTGRGELGGKLKLNLKF